MEQDEKKEIVSNLQSTYLLPIGSPETLINERILAVKTSANAKSDFGLNSDVIYLINKWSEFYGYLDTKKARAIVSCEGGDDPKICNKKYGCGSGMGHFQFIASTWNNICGGILGLSDIYNSNQNIQCGIYTLKNYGDSAWGTADTNWGSYQCWSPKI